MSPAKTCSEMFTAPLCLIEVLAVTSAPQDGVSSAFRPESLAYSGAVAGTTLLCILSTISSGDLARELKEGPARGGVLLSSLQEAS